MAKYTELLSEYLGGGGQLPAAFDIIPDFKNLFIGYFCDREIGFETEDLFAIKLETRANLVIPIYANRIAEIEAAESALQNPEKTRVKRGSISQGGQDKHTYDNSDHTTDEQDLPYAGIDAEKRLTRITTDKAHKDSDTIEYGKTETYNDVTDVEKGYTPAEAASLFKTLEDKVYIIKRECLKEFETLFMEIY